MVIIHVQGDLVRLTHPLRELVNDFPALLHCTFKGERGMTLPRRASVPTFFRRVRFDPKRFAGYGRTAVWQVHTEWDDILFSAVIPSLARYSYYSGALVRSGGLARAWRFDLAFAAVFARLAAG